MSPSSITLRQVSEAAQGFLRENHPEMSLPIPIEEIVELKLHIAIEAIPGIKQLLGIDAFISHDFSRIAVDDHAFLHYQQRCRFSIAHELGHMILHKEWYKANGPKTIDDVQSFQNGIDAKTYSYMERQADTFAGLVLVPKAQFLTEIAKITNNPEEINPLSTPLYELSSKFDVSEKVIIIRMQNEKIVSKINGIY